MNSFDPKLVNGNAKSHDRLARTIADFVDNDITSPELPGNRDAWLSDLKVRILERAVGHHKLFWSWLADVCSRAAKLAKSPDGRALLLIEELGSERRIQAPNLRVDYIKQLAVQVETIIGSLDTGPRKERLSSLLDYNLGIFARDIGDYDLAIDVQVRSAVKAEAAGDFVGASIARLCEWVERFNQALARPENISPLLYESFQKAAFRVAAICTGGDPSQIIWRNWNAPKHILEAHIWGLYPMNPADEKFWWRLLKEELPIADRGHFEKNYPEIEAIEAGLALLGNRRDEASMLADRVLQTTRDKRPEAQVTALFVKAVIAGDPYLKTIAGGVGHMYQFRSLANVILSSRVMYPGVLRASASYHIDRENVLNQ